ncbi:MAG: hypothetical protein ACREH3_09665, partial [Geminicoccales bacterium]
MTDRRGDAWLPGSSWPSVAFGANALLGAILVVGSGELAALPMVKGVLPASPLLLVEEAPAAKPSVQDERSSAADGAPLAELNQALAAARAKLEQLNQAAEALAGAAALR